LVPLACGIALLAVFRRPSIGRASSRLLDVTLGLSLAAIAIQLIPLSAALRGRLSPASLAYDRAMRFDALAVSGRPLSIAPAETLLALFSAASLVLLFWCARTVFEQSGARTTIRGIAWIGLFVSPLALVHHVMPLPVIDQAWGLTSGGLRTYGPFVNRNDFAGWLIMAIPLTLGYGIARLRAQRRAGASVTAPDAVDTTSLWLAMAAALMLGGLLSSLSRSGVAGAAAGMVCFAWLARGRVTAQGTVWGTAALVGILAVAAMYADFGALSSRFGSTFADGFSGRLAIWRQTLPVIRDFWPFGSGAGTYQSVMVLYQTMSRYYYITHADNEALQILAEGGLLLALPVALSLAAGAALVMKRLREDRSAIFWLRAGAATGMLAIGAQNMVEMTLRVPANAVLFAILAAVATCEGTGADEARSERASHAH
jgi:O-antigen ligase